MTIPKPDDALPSRSSDKVIAVPSPRRTRGEAQYLRRADAYVAAGQIEKALVHLRKLIVAHPRSTKGYLRIAFLLRQERRTGEALDVLRTAVRQSSRCAASREALAEVCLESGRWDEAITQGLVLLKLSPRSLLARDVLSAAYLQCGQIDAALRVTDEMIHLDPSDAANHFKKGVLLQQKGQIGAAVTAFARVLAMAPDEEVAEESRSALEMLDGHQIRQILTLAVEDVPFRLRLALNAEAAIAARGYLLSDAGLSALSQLCFDDLPAAPPGWRQYHHH